MCTSTTGGLTVFNIHSKFQDIDISFLFYLLNFVPVISHHHTRAKIINGKEKCMPCISLPVLLFLNSKKKKKKINVVSFIETQRWPIDVIARCDWIESDILLWSKWVLSWIDGLIEKCVARREQKGERESHVFDSIYNLKLLCCCVSWLWMLQISCSSSAYSLCTVPVGIGTIYIYMYMW